MAAAASYSYTLTKCLQENERAKQKIIVGKHGCKKTMKFESIEKGNGFIRYGCS
jgi:hypothetical protein